MPTCHHVATFWQDRSLYVAGDFFVSGTPVIQNWRPTQFLGISTVGSHIGTLMVTPIFFRLEVQNLHILKIMGIQDMSTNFIIIFDYNVAPILVN